MTQAANSTSPPRFAIIHERDMPTPRSRRSVGSVFGGFAGAIRAIIEDAYVSVAQEVLLRAEHLEDSRAERHHGKRVRKAARDRQKLEAGVEGARPATGRPAPVR